MNWKKNNELCSWRITDKNYRKVPSENPTR